MTETRGLLVCRRTRRDAKFIVMCLLAFAAAAGMAATSEPASTSQPTSRPSSGPAAVDPNALPGKKLAAADENALRRLYADMRRAFANSGEHALLAFMTADEARLAKPIAETHGRTLAKAKAMLAVAKAKGVPLRKESFDTDRYSIVMAVPDEKIHFRQRDPNSAAGFIIAADTSVEFARVAGQWKYTRELTADSAKFEIKLSQAFGKAFDEIAAGLKDGTITKDNCGPKAHEIVMAAIAPALREALGDDSDE